jgi:hypothetical protein
MQRALTLARRQCEADIPVLLQRQVSSALSNIARSLSPHKDPTRDLDDENVLAILQSASMVSQVAVVIGRFERHIACLVARFHVHVVTALQGAHTTRRHLKRARAVASFEAVAPPTGWLQEAVQRCEFVCQYAPEVTNVSVVLLSLLLHGVPASSAGSLVGENCRHRGNSIAWLPLSHGASCPLNG